MGIEATAVALTGSDQQITTGISGYRGFAIRETVGAAAVVQVFDNASANSGTLLDTIALAANGSASQLYSDGVRAAAGIRVHIVSGTVEGSVRIG